VRQSTLLEVLARGCLDEYEGEVSVFVLFSVFVFFICYLKSPKVISVFSRLSFSHST